MTDNNQLLEVLSEESVDFLRAVVDDNEEIKEEEDETEIESWDKIIVAGSFGFELLDQDNVATPALTLAETQEALEANIKDRDEDIGAGIEKVKEEKPKGEISVKEQQRKAQVEQVVKAPEEMKIKYASHAWDKIRTWVEMTKEEISGMGCVRREKDGSFYVYEVYLLKQDNTSAFTDIDDEALMALMWELQELDETDNGTRYDDLKYWWHSHNNMSTFWSGQDEKCIQEKLQHANWWLSTCHNIRNDVTTRLDIADPPTRFDNLKVEIDRVVSPEIKEFCRKEYEEKVTEKTSRAAYSYGNGFQGNYGQHYSGYGGYGHYSHQATTTQAAKARIEAAKAARAAELTGQYNKQTTTQTKETTQNQTSASLKSVSYAPIVNIADELVLVNATPAKAALVYQNEINLGMLYLAERMRSLVIGKVNFIGLAYNPRKATNPTDGTEWTIAGSVQCGPDKHCYMLVVWNDEPETVALSRIIEMRHRSPIGMLSIARTLTVGTDKFVNIILKCTPDNIIFDEGKHELHACVGIIFEAEEALPAMHLGEDFLNLEDSLSDDLMGEIVDIESETEAREDNTEELEAQEEAEETRELLEDLKEYAERIPVATIESRILRTIASADKTTLIDVLGLLACNMAKDADEQALDEEADWLTVDQLTEKIEMFVKRNPREAFPYVWNVLPYMYLCSNCYEPTEAEDTICSYCKAKLPEVEE